MESWIRQIGAVGFVLAAHILHADVTPAQEEPAGWRDTAEFSFVVTQGNSETSTLGFKNKLLRKWDKSAFELNAGAIRVDSRGARFAVGTTLDFSVEEPDPELTAENYYLNGRFDRTITERFFWFAGAGWDRNEFAGIENRYTGFGGVGNLWVEKKKVTFRTDYSVSFTNQDDVVEDPDVDDTFLGLRISSAYSHHLNEITTYGNDLIVDENLDETSDLRADMTNWVTVSMTGRLALKVSLQWLYDAEPALEEIDLFDMDPGQGGTVIGTVTNELDELDTVFTASLVVNL